MNSNVPELEQRLSSLQAEMERRLGKPEGDAGSPDDRLARLTEHCAEILRRWALAGERHEQLVRQLEAHVKEWEQTGTRLQHDTSERMQALEHIVQREWEALHDLHQQPIRELREQASSLTEVSIATAHAAQHGFDRAESRLAAIESDLHRRMTELTHEVRQAISELRLRTDDPLARLERETPSWSLDEVTNLHRQLRETSERNDTGTLSTLAVESPQAPEPAIVSRQLPEAPSHLSDRLESLERTVTDYGTETRTAIERSTRATRTWQIAALGLACVLVAAVWLAWGQTRQAAGRAAEAERQSQMAADAAARQATAAREEAARQIGAARETAARAQRVSDVLAAPDLIRFNLTGRDSLTGASAQLLWSRSRGMVFSGSRLVSPANGSAYQVWLLTRTDPVSAGTFMPDPSGSITIVQDAPPVPRAVLGAFVTLEPASGNVSPSSAALLARVPPPSPEQP